MYFGRLLIFSTVYHAIRSHPRQTPRSGEQEIEPLFFIFMASDEMCYACFGRTTRLFDKYIRPFDVCSFRNEIISLTNKIIMRHTIVPSSPWQRLLPQSSSKCVYTMYLGNWARHQFVLVKNYTVKSNYYKLDLQKINLLKRTRY